MNTWHYAVLMTVLRLLLLGLLVLLLLLGLLLLLLLLLLGLWLVVVVFASQHCSRRQAPGALLCELVVIEWNAVLFILLPDSLISTSSA